jgi:hypothetical protein
MDDGEVEMDDGEMSDLIRALGRADEALKSPASRQTVAPANGSFAAI